MKIRVLTRKPVKVPLRVTKGGMAFKVIYVYVKS
jgi:hypothetical protein